MSELSLFEQLGGEAAVDAAVDAFYPKLLADDLLSPFFNGINMERQAKKQKAFLTVAFGGPNKYSGRAMRAAHAKAVEQGMTDQHFDAVDSHLAETLRELGVAADQIEQVAKIAESIRDDVQGR